MNKYFIWIILLFTNLNIVNAQNNKPKAEVRIVVYNIKNTNGNIKGGLFSSKEDYENKKSTAFKRNRVNIDKDKATLIFTDVPYGDYTAKIFHDENNDVKVNTNWIGIPSEGFGISNNAIGTFGPQSYDKAKFTVDKPLITLYVKLKYY